MREQRGFSLIELVLVMVIIGLISVVVGRILLQSGRSFVISHNASQVDWQGYAALSRLTDDVHTIRSKNDISTISTTNFSFTNASGSTVQYVLSGNTLLRNSQVIASGVSALTFSYLSSTGVATATASSVRYVGISMTLASGSVSTTFSTLVGTRGLT